MLDRYDNNSVGQLAVDNGTQITTPALLTNTKVIAALADASGELEASATEGQKYSPVDLLAMMAAGGNGAAIIKRIVCDLAFGYLRLRRGFPGDPGTKSFERAEKFLESLRTGVAILPFLETQEAGNPESEFMNQQQLNALGLVTRCPGPRWYGRRQQFPNQY